MITITKNNKAYVVTELKHDWKLSVASLPVTIDYKIPKEACKTIEDLKRYVLNNELF